MAKRRLTALVFVAMGLAALTGCASKSTTPPANTPGGSTPTTVTSSGGGGGYGY